MDIIINFDYHSYSKLLISSVIIGASYYPLKKVLNKYSNFEKLKDDKKMYVTKNIVKSVILAPLSINLSKQLFNLVLERDINQLFFRNYGALYVANDLAGLLFVRNLPNSTKLHHTSTILLYTILCAYDINKNSICRMMAVYTIFSCYPFLVNTYLGIRYLKDKDTKIEKYNYNMNSLIDITRRTSYYTYVMSCSLNWSTHAFFFARLIYNRNLTYLDMIYSAILYPIVRDDLILMDWLKKNK
jgi:hypothetical protein